MIGDVVAHATKDTDHPVLLDLGCGPGSLSARLADRLPGATIIGLDSDPCCSPWRRPGTRSPLLLAAGFAEAGTVWQSCDDQVLVGIR